MIDFLKQPVIYGRAFVLLVALWLGWTIIANTAATTLALLDAEEALSWRTEQPRALVSLAEQQMTVENTPPDNAEIRQLAERALVAAPLEHRALRVLALVAELDEDLDQADILMRRAAARSRRDALVQIWSFKRSAQLGDFDRALMHADALLRSRSHLNEHILPTMIAFAVDQESKDSVVRLLATNPPWRRWYLEQVVRQMDDPGVAYSLYADLKSGQAPPSDAELRPYLTKMIDSGRLEQAYLTWINYLPDERRRSISYVYNGDFEYPLSGLPFDWMIGGITGAKTEIVEAPDQKTGRAVRVEFANRRVAYRHLRKLLMLPPGGYSLTSSVRAKDLQNERGLVWRVSCAETDRQVLGETPPVTGTFDWVKKSILFEVPQTDCRAQWLTLVLAARVALEEQISGEVWFDDLSIERADRAKGKVVPAQ